MSPAAAEMIAAEVWAEENFEMVNDSQDMCGSQRAEPSATWSEASAAKRRRRARLKDTRSFGHSADPELRPAYDPSASLPQEPLAGILPDGPTNAGPPGETPTTHSPK